MRLYEQGVYWHRRLDTQRSKWERLLESGDDGQVWRAINWRGELGQCPIPNSQLPTDNQFKQHIEINFNPTDVQEWEDDDTEV